MIDIHDSSQNVVVVRLSQESVVNQPKDSTQMNASQQVEVSKF
jgi:hypothetical protein